jgi:hypothetical protein
MTLERMVTMPGRSVSMTAAAASSHEDSIPKISISLLHCAPLVSFAPPAALGESAPELSPVSAPEPESEPSGGSGWFDSDGGGAASASSAPSY